MSELRITRSRRVGGPLVDDASRFDTIRGFGVFVMENHSLLKS